MIMEMVAGMKSIMKSILLLCLNELMTFITMIVVFPGMLPPKNRYYGANATSGRVAELPHGGAP